MPTARRLPLKALAALAILGSAACSDGADPEDRIAWLTARAQQVRELPLAHDVAVVEMTRDEYLAQADAKAKKIDDAELAELAATYGRLGFFDPSLDLHATLGSPSNDWVAATYSSDPERITLIGNAQDSTIVHEFVHALQDQHFDLDAYQAEDQTSDTAIARSAIAEGDAMLAETRFVGQERYGADLDALDWPKVYPLLAQQVADVLEKSDVPLLFASYESFVYTFGFAYCAHTLTGVTPASPGPSVAFPYAWSREDALFGKGGAPNGARAILTLDAPAADAQVGLDAVPAAFADRYQSIDGDVLGPWFSYLLLYPQSHGAGPSPVDVAATWQGDRILFVHDGQAGTDGVVWAAAWTDDAAAGWLESGLRALHGVTGTDPAEPRLGVAKDGEPVWLERAGAAVVFLKNVDPAVAPDLAAAALPAATAKSSSTHSQPSLGVRLVKRLQSHH